MPSLFVSILLVVCLFRMTPLAVDDEEYQERR